MKVTLIIGIIFSLSLLTGSVWAADYSANTTEELNAMRGTMRNAPDVERKAFVGEWQNRLQVMTPEEREKYMGRPTNAPADGKGYRNNAPGERTLGFGRGRKR